MASRTIIQHNSSALKSLQVFYKLLPEFSESPKTLNSIVDKAFNISIMQGISDVKEWKPIRDEALQTQPQLTPRELARFKFSLCYRSPLLLDSYLGRPALHSWLESKAKSLLPHMTCLELISVLTAFSSTASAEFYTEALSCLHKEIATETDLSTLAMSVYTVFTYYNHPKAPIPTIKDPAHSVFCKTFIELISPVLIDKVTEFSDDQFATICAGLGKASIEFSSIDAIYPLTDALQSDLLHRRVKRMTLDNLVDVASGFFYNNLGSDELYKGILGKVMEKRKEFNYNNAVDFAMAISQREICNKEILNITNGLIKQNMGSEDYVKISKYAVSTECKDEEILKKLVENTTKKNMPDYEYQDIKKLQYYLNRFYKNLVTDEFIERLEKTGYLFNGGRYKTHSTEINTKQFKEFERWLQFLDQPIIGPYSYSNHDYFHWAWMPQKIGLMLAMPKYHLIGKWEVDTRIIKEPKRHYKIANSFEIRCKWLELLDFKVIRMNYQEVSENANSKTERDKNFLDFIKPLLNPQPAGKSKK